MSTASRTSALSIAAGAVVVAGAATAVWPQHAMSVARVLVATVAVIALVAAIGAGLHGIDSAPADPTRPPSPFESTATRRRFHRDQPSSLVRVRGEIGYGVVRADLPPLSALAARRVAIVATTALAREGLDLADPDHAAAVRARLSPQALTTITADRAMRPPAGQAPHPRRQAAAEEIAATVHAVLDEVERPPSSPGAP